MMYWGSHTGPGGWVGGLIGLLFWLVLIGLIVLLAVRLFWDPAAPDRSWSQQPRPDDPEEIRGRGSPGVDPHRTSSSSGSRS